MKLKDDKLLSNFAFNCNLPRPYTEGTAGVPGDVTLINKWVAFDADTLAPPAAVLTAMLTSKATFNKGAYDAAMKELEVGRCRLTLG